MSAGAVSTREGADVTVSPALVDVMSAGTASVVLVEAESEVLDSEVLTGAVVVSVVPSEVAPGVAVSVAPVGPASAEAFFAVRFAAAARGGVCASGSEMAAPGPVVSADSFAV
ncbi:hypothetical protein D7V93_42860 [Corallococcus llansteffanensis]|uniref:Uncharacterized protein n=2 Tax=Corallococcus llansteffanensis TaxID=2316731 RepID=A0A3A8MWK3_9BACT|nr:hypothetical protein D7V93_42860 [Corallococcus llansteffanensis]